jgi:hypothetical protein
MAMLQRKVSGCAVCAAAAQPFGKESLLAFALVEQVPTEQRSQGLVGFDAVVQSVDQRVDRRAAADLFEDGALGKRSMRADSRQKTPVLERGDHCANASTHATSESEPGSKFRTSLQRTSSAILWLLRTTE